MYMGAHVALCYHKMYTKTEADSKTPWERGKLLVWDVTLPDSLEPSYRSTGVAGLVEELAESNATCV